MYTLLVPTIAAGSITLWMDTCLHHLVQQSFLNRGVNEKDSEHSGLHFFTLHKITVSTYDWVNGEEDT